MKRPRQIDFECPCCGFSESRLIETEDDNTPCEAQLCSNPELFPADEAQPAGYCRAPMRQLDGAFSGYMKTITKGNHDFNERERERLEKRGDDHWKKTGRDEAIATERAYLKKHGAYGGVR